MIDYESLRATAVPQAALDAYHKYKGDQQAAARARDDDALAKMQAWGAFIEAQQTSADSGPTKVQAKHIPEVFVLAFLKSLNGTPATWFDNSGELFANSVQYGMPSGIPPKVALAKMAAMIRKGLVEGCACGCRGDFLITDKGRAMLAEVDAKALNDDFHD